MNLFRSPELQRELLLFSLCALVLTLAASFLGAAAALAVGFSSLVMGALHFFAVYKRQDRIRALAAQLSAILQEGKSLSLEEYNEGELALLRSELQKLLTSLDTSRAKLAEDKRLLSESLADISHQLRTPLTSIGLIVAMLGQPDLPLERKRELLSQLNQLLSRTDWLVEALLKLSKLDAGTAVFQPQQIRFNALVRQAFSPLELAFELRGLQFITDGDDPVVELDPIWTAEAISNLLKNAMEHTPSGGEIRLTCEENPLYTKITLADTGEGFSQEDLPHLFERFYRGKNASNQSFGIGLALSRRIIAEQNGTIQATSSPNGAVFTVKFYRTANQNGI